jgi:methylated-DNA-protein-cysteine methyltransferase-like protein
MAQQSNLYQRIYALVRRIPSGRVTTYGQLARLTGTTPRTVGYALAALPAANDLPWQRVVNRYGMVSRRRDGEREPLQRTLLESEGVNFDSRDRIDLSHYGWHFPAAD